MAVSALLLETGDALLLEDDLTALLLEQDFAEFTITGRRTVSDTTDARTITELYA